MPLLGNDARKDNRMSELLKTPITWRNIVLVGLVWAAEDFVLALIGDSTTIIKVATVLTALAALAVLQFETWLRGKHRVLFPSSISALTIIYIGFVGYAVIHAYHRSVVWNRLEELYAAAGPLMNKPITIESDETDSSAVDQFESDVNDWETKTAKHLEDNFGDPARERFLDVSSAITYVAGNRGLAYQKYQKVSSRFINRRKNLSVIIESHAYDR